MVSLRASAISAVIPGLIVLSLSGCGSSARTSTAPSPLVRCSLTLSVGEQPIPAQGGAGTIGVSATRECTWTVEVDGSWLSLRSGRNGQGDGTVEFTAAANPDPVARRGALVLNGQRAEITQTAAVCDISLAQTSASFSPAGGSGQVDVRASSALCTWTASADQPWVAIRSGADGRGSGPVLFDVAATTGPPRTATMTIGGQRFSVTQSEGCTYAISPASASTPPSGGGGVVTIATAAGCPWTAVSNVNWLAFAQPQGSGPAPVSFSVQATTGPARTGTAVVAGQTFTVTQSQGCTYQVQPAAHSVGASGGTATVSVSAGAGCPWSASSNASWITINGGTSGSGSGAVSFSVAASTGPSRSGTLTIAGQTVTVSQGQGCTYAISPTQESVPASGGGGRIGVTAGDGCAWTASSATPWITIASGGSGSGNGTVNYTVAATTGPARSGTLQVAGQTFTVNQGQGCTFNLNPASATVAPGGGPTQFEVQTSAGCAWTASTQTPWISIASGANGNGTGAVQLTVAANSGPARTGTVTAAGRTFTVNQGEGCTYAIAPTSEAMAAGGGAGTVGVTAGAGCAWTASSNAPWLTLSGAAGGTGSGSVSYSAAANTGGPRSGTLTVAGATFTVNQAGGCTFTVAPETLAPAAAGGAARVDVSTAADCAWTASSALPWVTVTAGASGSGPGPVDLSIAPNSGPARSGTVTVAGRTVTISQAGNCTFTVAPDQVASPAGGGPARVDVTASAPDCTWTASTAEPWITIAAGASGTGAGAVDLSVAANSGPARSGVVTVAGRAVTVSQASGCVVTIDPAAAAAPLAGGTGSVTVRTTAGCTWTAASQAAWISIVSGASGAGDGVVQYSVEASAAPRTGTIVIGGQTFTVNQQ